ncbi:hypothetical protein [Haloferax sp. ATB1]|uniref:hypothetical protein n=1 Tax=Haloferax sp. ATB1 TaxID=1508454 RepID=UPI000A9EAAB5|nr:hypothetical protein [Haloferax sp. ATB1]
MIAREEVFDVDAFVPADLVHRNHELNLLSTASTDSFTIPQLNPGDEGLRFGGGCA